MKHLAPALFVSFLLAACGPGAVSEPGWQTDFFDDFETFDAENWQDQILWVNNEHQCYVRDGQYDTRVVSDGTLKLKVVALDEEIDCDNMSKQGEKHPDTKYVAGRLASKNRKEFVQGRWTARLKISDSGVDGMFPAWWLLGARNNEPPVEEADENICWPMTGSGEIDIFEHHGASGKDHYVARTIKGLPDCQGDWWTYQMGLEATLEEYHEYAVEWSGEDIVYLLDGVEAARNDSLGGLYPEPLFAILNYAKITDAPMTGEWVMEVDWVKHEFWGE
ncbi:MAG: beta-glucanase (GH16 family) [Rhodothermales bacterium]|jgi:beta-glucanase (GH16 family)